MNATASVNNQISKSQQNKIRRIICELKKPETDKRGYALSVSEEREAYADLKYKARLGILSEQEKPFAERLGMVEKQQ